jgi:plastin-1
MSLSCNPPCRLQLLSPINLRNRDVPGLVLLAGESDTLDELLRMAPEALLLRWFNFQTTHVREGVAGGPPIKEFGPPLASGVALCALMRCVFPTVVDSGVPATDAQAIALGPEAAIEAALSSAFGLGVPAWFSVNGIARGNLRLELALIACIFRVAPNMPEPQSPAPPTPGAAASAAARMRSGTGSTEIVSPQGFSLAHVLQLRAALHARLAVEEKDGDKQSLLREARTVAQWVNSLDIEGIAVHGQALSQELRDGVGLLKVLDVVEPGLVKWSKVNGRPTNRYKMVRMRCLLVGVHVARLQLLDPRFPPSSCTTGGEL